MCTSTLCNMMANMVIACMRAFVRPTCEQKSRLCNPHMSNHQKSNAAAFDVTHHMHIHRQSQTCFPTSILSRTNRTHVTPAETAAMRCKQTQYLHCKIALCACLQVAIFSRTWCPHSAEAKAVFASLVKPDADLYIMEVGGMCLN